MKLSQFLLMAVLALMLAATGARASSGEEAPATGCEDIKSTSECNLKDDPNMAHVVSDEDSTCVTMHVAADHEC